MRETKLAWALDTWMVLQPCQLQAFPSTTHFDSFQYSSETARKITTFPKTRYKFELIKKAGQNLNFKPFHDVFV